MREENFGKYHEKKEKKKKGSGQIELLVMTLGKLCCCYRPKDFVAKMTKR